MNLRRGAKALLKSLAWVSITIVFGLLHLWLVLVKSIVIPTFNVSYDQIILDGVLLFFVTAVVTALTTNYYFSDRRCPGWAELIMFVYYPFIILIVSVWLFGICLGKEVTDVNISFLKGVHYVLLFMTFIYAMIVKYVDFSDKENM